MNNLAIAAQFFYVYTFAKDTKLLFPIITHCYEAMKEKIAPLGDTFEEQLLKLQTNPKYSEEVHTLKELHQLIQEQKEAMVELAKKDKLIFFDESYHATSITENQALLYFKKAKVFIEMELTF